MISVWITSLYILDVYDLLVAHVATWAPYSLRDL